MIITVNIDNAAVGEATNRIAQQLVRQAPGICAVDARELATRYVQEQLEKSLALDAHDAIADLALFGVLGYKMPSDLVEKARKAASKADDR